MKTSLIKLPDGSFINPLQISRIVPIKIMHAHTKGNGRKLIETLIEEGMQTAVYISGIEAPLIVREEAHSFAQMIEETINSVN